MATRGPQAEPTAERIWGGSTLTERREQRRVALMDAALDLIGEGGGGAVTVRSVCRRANLTDRYFYENYPGRDELLTALLAEVSGQTYAALAAAFDRAGDDLRVRAEAVVNAAAAIVLDDPRKGRLLLVEPLSDRALISASMASMPTFTRMVQTHFAPPGTRSERALAAVGLAGALGALFSSWLAGTLKVTRKELLAHCVELLVAAHG